MKTSPRVNEPHSSYHNSTRQREPVLIVAYGDGWVEVYAEKHVDVRFEIAPLVTTPAGEIAAEKYLEARLPRRYRDLYWPNLRRAADLVRVIRPSDIQQRDWALELLRSIERAGEILSGQSKEARRIWTL